MFKIDWHQLEKNAKGSPQDFFEKFIYQIAVKRYQSLGLIKYFYNTPGSEFYLILNKDCEFEGISLRSGDVIGWQAKFWFNRSDPDNSPLNSGKRAELVDDFKKSLEYKPSLKVWIICTPGLFSNTQTSSGIKPYEELEKGLKAIKSDIRIIHWNKPLFESFAHAEPEKYGSIFNYYCSTHFLSFKVFEDHSGKRLDILRKRYDTDLYTPGKADKSILSSIFYKDLVDKLHNKIKHALEDKEKLVGGHLYRVVIDKFLTSTGIPDDEKETIRKLKKLIDAFLSLHDKLHTYKEQENTLEFIKHLFRILDSNRDEINTLIEESRLHERHSNLNYINIDYDLDIEHTWHLINCLHSIAGNWSKRAIKIYMLTNHISRQVFNIFGEAGFGKTNLACYVAEQLLTKKLPVLLIPASEIKGTGDSIQKQIASFFGIDASNGFDNFIGILDSIGFHYGIKVPIIIDGLNETQPSASEWKPHLQYIIDDIKKFSNVMLITTCRNAYTKQIFDEEQIDVIPDSLVLEGFKENIEEAIKKYFHKYKITVKNEDYDRELFNNPFLLKLFSQANKGKSIEINETSIYRAIDAYVAEILNRISIHQGDVNPLIKSQALKGINDYSLCLWNNKSRGIAYPDELVKYFDPKYSGGVWHDTVTHKVIDEGLLFRNIHDDVEFAEFTDDLIGGYCIAKSLFFDNKKADEIISAVTYRDTILKLTSERPSDRHPLAEDILKAMVFLAPEHTGKELFELIDNQEVVRSSLQVLRIIISRAEGVEALIKKFESISPDSPILPQLLDSLADEILRRDENIILSELLETVLLNLTSCQVDLSWSEIIRRKSDKIISYLHQMIELFESGKEWKEHIHWRLCFNSLLLSSTNRYLRDLATKALVIIGRKYPEALIDVFLRLERAKDFYVLERLIASICGVFLAIDNKELLFRVCKHLEKNYIENIRTTHVLILDYIITLLDYAERKFGYVRSIRRPAKACLIEWQRDPECVREVTGDGKATWGFGPVEYDFAKYKIGTYLAQYRYEKDSKLPTLKDALAMVIWRTKELGYTKELFEEVDKALSDQEHKRWGYNSSFASTEYRKKYRDIAFYELYGHNIIRGFGKDFKDEDGFRVSPAYIDPTFPSISTKRQLITCCFLPRKPDDVQAWIDNNDSAFMEAHYIRTDIEKDEAEWVMLYGHLVQKGIEKSRIDISLYTIMVPEDGADIIIGKIVRNELFMHYLVAENYNVYAGEIPWSENYLDGIRYEEIDGVEVELYLPVSSYYQETKSEIEVVRRVYVLSKRLAQTLGLRINLSDFNLYTTNGEKASSYIHDNYSNFVYFRKDLLQKYLHNSRQSMIWLEIASKYGAFGEHKSKYKPSFKDYRIVKKYS